jgi:hypothetical protein
MVDPFKRSTCHLNPLNIINKIFLNIFRRRLGRLLHRLHYGRWTQVENCVVGGKLSGFWQAGKPPSL